jgi:DNA-binding NtrC family response regulator
MKKHILLIDDDRDELTIFMDALADVPGSFKCTYASSASQGLQMLQYLHPDFIFIDYNLPPTNGLRLLSEIKKETTNWTVSLYTFIQRQFRVLSVKKPKHLVQQAVLSRRQV